MRRRAGAVYRACLENKNTGNGIGGSNPPASALDMKLNGIKVLVTEPGYFTREFFKIVRKTGEVTAKRMSRAELLKNIKNFDAVVVRVDTKLDRKVIEAGRKLKCVVSTTTGLNHIDTDYLKKKDIPLFSLTGSHSVPTAEHALALIFALARRIPWANSSMHKGHWRRWEYLGIEITGKTLGVLGIGRIGKEVAKRAKAFGMKVVAFDPYVSSKEVLKRRAKKVSWNEFLSKSDFFSLHAPLTLETKHMFGKKEFSKMKSSAIFVNTARGEIVEERALLEALSKKKIKAAGVDVYPEEPLPRDHELRRYAKSHDNLIITPHIAASTHEAVGRASVFAGEALVGFFRKRRLF